MQSEITNKSYMGKSPRKERTRCIAAKVPQTLYKRVKQYQSGLHKTTVVEATNQLIELGLKHVETNP